jgi:hypothetical protein
MTNSITFAFLVKNEKWLCFGNGKIEQNADVEIYRDELSAIPDIKSLPFEKRPDTLKDLLTQRIRELGEKRKEFITRIMDFKEDPEYLFHILPNLNEIMDGYVYDEIRICRKSIEIYGHWNEIQCLIIIKRKRGYFGFEF